MVQYNQFILDSDTYTTRILHRIYLYETIDGPCRVLSDGMSE